MTNRTRRERSGKKTFGRTMVADSKYVFRVQVLKLFHEIYLFQIWSKTTDPFFLKKNYWFFFNDDTRTRVDTWIITYITLVFYLKFHITSAVVLIVLSLWTAATALGRTISISYSTYNRFSDRCRKSSIVKIYRKRREPVISLSRDIFGADKPSSMSTEIRLHFRLKMLAFHFFWS